MLDNEDDELKIWEDDEPLPILGVVAAICIFGWFLVASFLIVMWVW